MEGELEDVTIPAGTVIQWEGLPFRLTEPVTVKGRQANAEYARLFRTTAQFYQGIEG